MAESLWQLHFVVDGRSLPERVHGRVMTAPDAVCFDTVSVADRAWPQQAAGGLRQLTGELERDPEWDVLDEGRLPLYVFSECGDVYCGVVTVAVCRHVDPESGHEVVQWEQLRYEDALSPADQMPGLSSVGPFTFDGEQYDEVLSAAALRLDDLVARELQAETAWKQQRRLRGASRR